MAGTIKADTWLNGDGTENYKCRAWCNFNGEGTVSIRGSGNISSLVDLQTGGYRLNFINNLVDANYSVVGVGNSGSYYTDTFEADTFTTSYFNAWTYSRGTSTSGNTTITDLPFIHFAVFR